MTLTDAQAWLVLIGGTIGLATTAVVTIVNTVRMGRIQATTTEIEKKTDVIEKNTNNKLTMQDRRIAEQDAEIAQLKVSRAEQERVRADLAMETARAIMPSLPPAPAAPSPVPPGEETIIIPHVPASLPIPLPVVVVDDLTKSEKVP